MRVKATTICVIYSRLNTYCRALGLALLLGLGVVCASATVAVPADTLTVVAPADSLSLGKQVPQRSDSLSVSARIARSTRAFTPDTLLLTADSIPDTSMGNVRIFNPDPVRALWLSALCPGLGQIYNRRYWKLPIVVGAFVGLGYGTTWNNRMLNDYTKAYRDVMDSDPNTHSYMDFFPPTVKESDLDPAWLKKVLKNKKDYYRRYRDICIIGIVGVYLLNIVDAYVDASLSHFDISPDLSMDVSPAVINNSALSPKPSFGLQCAFNF